MFKDAMNVTALKLMVKARPTSFRQALLVFLFALVPCSASAQSHTLDVSQYLHRSWTTQEGFFKGPVNSVAQTSDGYLWVVSGTGGLLRFDGIRFSEWKPAPNDSLPRKPLHHLLASSDGSLWVGGMGLAELKPNGELRHYHQLDGTEIEGALIEDREGGIWAGGGSASKSSPLCRIHHGESDCYSTDSFLGGKVWGLHEDRSGQLFACAMTGIWRIRPGPPQKIAPGIKDGLVCGEDSTGSLVFSTEVGVQTMTSAGKLTPSPVELGEARALLTDREGDLWDATVGRGILHVHNGKTDTFTTSEGLSSNSVIYIFQDREGNVWAGTSRGLDEFAKPAIPSIRTQQGLLNDYINSVLTDRDGMTWVGTRGGLYRLDTHRITKFPLKLPNDIVTSLFQTSTGEILVGVDDSRGLVRLKKDKIFPLPTAAGENLFEVAEGYNGDIWVQSAQSGVQHLHKDGTLYESPGAKIGGAGLALDPKREGFWITSTNGVLRFYKDGKLGEKYGTKDGLGDGVNRDPQVDSDGSVWVSTRVGLGHLKDGKISLLGRRNGLPCDGVHWMRHDRDHDVWLYTECGLVAFSENDLATWVKESSHKVAVLHYLDNTDGVENVAYNGWFTPQAAATKDGRILFATSAGLSILDPRNLNQNTLAPPVHIEEVSADDREVKGVGRVSVPPGVRSIHIAFTALSFANPRKVLFRYKLLGFDKDWSAPTPLRQATYTNLPPKNYQFMVIACNNNGVWNTTGDALRLFIAPAFYQTMWFQGLVVIVFASVLWLFYAHRLRRVAAEINARMGERLHERERIARELHDTLLQDFQAVVLRFQIVASRLLQGDPHRQEIEDGLDFADSVLAEGRDRIRDIRADTNALDVLEESLSSYGRELTQFWPQSFELAVEGTPFALHPVLRDEIYRICREAIGNAFKHSKGSKVFVTVSYLESACCLRIVDDGEGISDEVLVDGRPGHWGIQSMQERARKISATLKFSKEDRGTSVKLEVPRRLATKSRWQWPFSRGMATGMR